MLEFSRPSIVPPPPPPFAEEVEIEAKQQVADGDAAAVELGGVTSCVCGRNNEEVEEGRMMLQCDGCLVWQHVECVFGSEHVKLPRKYYCTGECKDKVLLVSKGKGGNKVTKGGGKKKKPTTTTTTPKQQPPPPPP